MKAARVAAPAKWPISDGALIGITGPSGSGKTTTLKSLCKQYKVLVADADGHARMRLRDEVTAGMCIVKRVNTYDAATNLVVELRDGHQDIHVVAVDSLSLLSERLVREATVAAEKDTPEKQERLGASDRLRNLFLEFAKLADPDEYEHPRHVIFTCLEGRWKVGEVAQGKEGFTSKRTVPLEEGAVGSIFYGPLLPGKFADDFSAWMTENFRLIVVPKGGKRERWFVTDYDGQFLAKDVSGRLDFHEPADLLKVLEKIYAKG